MPKQIITVGLAITLALTLSSCGSEPGEGDPAREPTSWGTTAIDSSESTSSTEVSDESTWAPPTDGRWPHKAHGKLLGFGDEFIVKSVYGPMYSGAVVGPPQFDDFADGQVTFSQEVVLTRLEAAWGEPTATVDVALVFGIDEFSEGDDMQVSGSVQCGDGAVATGDSVTCMISARTSTANTLNSSWIVGNYFAQRFAAWPGQEARP